MNLITNTDIFDSNNIDHDLVKEDTKFINLYNNTMNKPFQKFWFIINDASFIHDYDNFKTICFAFNSKSNKNKKLVLYVKNIEDFVDKLCKDKIKNYMIQPPWKSSFNYPYIVNFKNIIKKFHDQNGDEIKMKELNKNKTYNILFELKCYVLNDENIIKTKLELIKIQENKSNNTIDLSQTEKIIYNHHINHEINNITTPLPKHNSNTNNNTNTNVKPIPQLSFNIKELLNVKNLLKKTNTNKEIENNDNDNNNDDNEIKEFVDCKNSLKKVVTTEKSLMNNLTSKKIKKDKKHNKKDKKNKKIK
jgi:hypothetical protein